MAWVARLGDMVVGTSIHYGPPVPPATFGPPVPYPVAGPLKDNPIALPGEVPLLVGGQQVAYEGATGDHTVPICQSPLGTAVTSVDPALHKFKVPLGLPTVVPVLVNNKKLLVIGSVSQHCHDIAPAPTGPVSIGAITTGSPLLDL